MRVPPPETLNSPVDVAEFEPNVQEPEPLKVRLLKGVEVAITFFCCVEVELKVVELLLNVYRAEEEANQLPASVNALEPIERMEEVETPSWRAP